jgi:hypothetical protein
MVISREQLVAYWASAPASTRRPGEFALWAILFPDLDTLSPAERDLLRPVLAAHPEYLLQEIECSKEAQ